MSLSQDRLDKLAKKAGREQQAAPAKQEPMWKENDRGPNRQKWPVIVGAVIGVCVLIGILVVVITSNSQMSQQPESVQESRVTYDENLSDDGFLEDTKPIVGNHTTATDESVASDAPASADENDSAEGAESTVGENTEEEQDDVALDDVVSLRIPASVAYLTTQDSVTAYVEEEGWFGGQLNQDGSILYTMTVGDQQKILEDLTAEFQTKIDQYESAGTITDASVSSGWSVLTITVQAEADMKDVAADLMETCKVYLAYSGDSSRSVRASVVLSGGESVASYQEVDVGLA